MRIIAGKHRGRILKEIKFDGVRPTHDRAKEALFNILQKEVINCSFLDLFGGSGSVGLEAISRGAKKVVFVDNFKESINLINSNLKLVNEYAEVIKSDAISFLNTTKENFDIIFIDPPYSTSLGEEAIKTIDKNNMLKLGGIAILEQSQIKNIECVNIEKYDERKYGLNHFSFYKQKEL